MKNKKRYFQLILILVCVTGSGAFLSRCGSGMGPSASSNVTPSKF